MTDDDIIGDSIVTAGCSCCWTRHDYDIPNLLAEADRHLLLGTGHRVRFWAWSCATCCSKRPVARRTLERFALDIAGTPG